jgi:hypothetical protein
MRRNVERRFVTRKNNPTLQTLGGLQLVIELAFWAAHRGWSRGFRSEHSCRKNRLLLLAYDHIQRKVTNDRIHRLDAPIGNGLPAGSDVLALAAARCTSTQAWLGITEHCHQDDDADDYGSEQQYLPDTIRTFTFNISGAGVDGHMIDLSLKPVRPNPHRQQ